MLSGALGSERRLTVIPSVMDESLADDPTYRAGVLMGRQQAVTDIMELLLDPKGGTTADKLLSVMEWCGQTLEEGKVEIQLVVAALRDDGD